MPAKLVMRPPVPSNISHSFTNIEVLLHTDTNHPRWIVTRQVGKNSYLERRPDGIALRLHETDILLWHPDDTMTLDTGGWWTSVTMERMNTWLPRGKNRHVQIYQDGGFWYVSFSKDKRDRSLSRASFSDARTAFHRGMVVDLRTCTEWSKGENWSIEFEHNKMIDKNITDYFKDLLAFWEYRSVRNVINETWPEKEEADTWESLDYRRKIFLTRALNHRVYDPSILGEAARQYLQHTNYTALLNMWETDAKRGVTSDVKRALRGLFRSWLYWGPAGETGKRRRQALDATLYPNSYS